MIHTLLTIYNQDQPLEHDTEFPRFDPEWNLILDKEEEIVWTGRASDASLASKGIQGWKLQGIDITITNQRIAYLCKEYKKAGVWFGGALALPFQMIDSAWTAYSRRGKAAVGHIRHQWPMMIMQSTSKHTDMVRSSNDFSVYLSDAEQRTYIVKFRMPKEERDKAAHMLIGHIASFRVARDFSTKKFPNEDPKELETAKKQVLERLTKCDKTDNTPLATVDYYAFGKTNLPIPRLE